LAHSPLAFVIPEGFDASAGTEQETETEIDFRTPGTYSVNGRYSLLCSTIGLSSQGLALSVVIKPKIGDRIDAVFETIGCVPGRVSEINEFGFIMNIDVDTHNSLRKQIEFLATPRPDDANRRHLRIVPRNPETMITVADKRCFSAYVVDFSISGACIETDAFLSFHDEIAFPCSTKATVVRMLGNRRFGVEFDRQLAPHEFATTTRL
jgi:hypothetical protein